MLALFLHLDGSFSYHEANDDGLWYAIEDEEAVDPMTLAGMAEPLRIFVRRRGLYPPSWSGPLRSTWRFGEILKLQYRIESWYKERKFV